MVSSDKHQIKPYQSHISIKQAEYRSRMLPSLILLSNCCLHPSNDLSKMCIYRSSCLHAFAHDLECSSNPCWTSRYDATCDANPRQDRDQWLSLFSSSRSQSLCPPPLIYILTHISFITSLHSEMMTQFTRLCMVTNLIKSKDRSYDDGKPYGSSRPSQDTPQARPSLASYAQDHGIKEIGTMEIIPNKIPQFRSVRIMYPALSDEEDSQEQDQTPRVRKHMELTLIICNGR